MTRAASHDVLARMGDDVRQLTEPIHTVVRRTIVTHPCLLDQLRDGASPAAGQQGPERRRVPDSRPPAGWTADTSDALAEVYVGIAFWRTKLGLPSPPREADWHKAMLRALVGAAPTLAPSISDWLAADVESWWTLAARRTGWTLEQLRRLR